MAINSGDDRRRIIPLALVSVLTALIDDVGIDPTYTRVELRRIRAMLCRLYRVEIPQDAANSSAVAQELEEQDGVPIES